MILLSSSFDSRLWRNWQTHQTQNLAVVISCGFESHQPHWRNLENSRFLFLCCKAEMFGIDHCWLCMVLYVLWISVWMAACRRTFLLGYYGKSLCSEWKKINFQEILWFSIKGSSRLFFIKNTHAFACVSFLVFRFFHDPAFSCTFIAIFPAQGTAIAADGTSVLISHITQCHTKDDKQKLSHTIPPLIWVVSSGVFIIIPENAKIRKSIMQKGYGKRQ